MDPDRGPSDWTRADELFDEALGLGPGERGAFLARLRSNDPVLADEVARLLATAQELGTFLERGADAILSAPGASAHEHALASEGPPLVDPSDAPREGRYRLVRRLGRGGMATVYLAERDDGRVRGKVAIKVLRKGVDTDEVLSHFLAERQILATLSHPNIAMLLDAGETGDGRPFLVMEYVEGRSLADYWQAEAPPLTSRLQLFRTICDAVQHAHQHLVVHRDLKPSNVIVRSDGTVKLLDFGIAKLLEPGGDGAGDARTRTGVRLFSPEYASPEQLTGARITTATDVYQLGCLLYFLLSGRPPHRREGWMGVGAGVVAEEAPAPSTMLRGQTGGVRIPSDLDAIAMRAVSPDPSRRYQTVGELSDDIERLMAGLPVRAKAPTRLYRGRRFVSRHRWATAVGALALLAGGWHVRTLQVHARELTRERDRAAAEAATARQVADFVGEIFGQVNPRVERGDTLSARTLLDRAKAKLPDERRTDPAVRASVLAAVAAAYGRLGMFEQALPLYQEAAAILASRPPEDPERIYVQERLGAASHSRRRLEEARAAWSEAIAGHRARLAAAPGDPDLETALARALASLAFAGGSDGSDGSQELAAREAIGLMERHSDADPTALANARRVLAGVLERRGEGQAAEALYRSAIEALGSARRSAAPDLEAQLAATTSALGLSLERQGRDEEAKALLEEALALFEEALGPLHPTTISALMNVVNVAPLVGEAPARIAKAREWVARERASATSAPDRLVRALHQLGFQLRTTGDLAGAEGALREALGVAELRGPPAGRAAFLAGVELGRTLRQGNNLADAVAVLEHALGPDGGASEHPPATRAQARNLLAEVLDALGRTEEAARERAEAARLGGAATAPRES